MKRGCAILLVLVVMTALLAACTKNETPQSTPSTSNTAASPTPVPTTPPDFADVDFSGNWSVSAVLDENGQAVSADQMAQMGADFTLEITKSGAYFIYSAEGEPIGQGQYSVSANQLVLSASGMQTTYIIQDANTLRCEAEDGSVTVMTRCADCEDEEEDTEALPDDTATLPDETGTETTEELDAP